MTQEQSNKAVTVSNILSELRDKMRDKCSVGEPCIQLPISEIKTFKDDEGNWQAVMGMDQFVYFVDGLLRRSLS